MRLRAGGVVGTALASATACAALALMGACANEARPVAGAPIALGFSDAGVATESLPSVPPHYVLADLPLRIALVPVGKTEGQGIVLDGLRMVTSVSAGGAGGGAGGGSGLAFRSAVDVTDPPLVVPDRIPAWLGGGFLFRSATALFTSETFDGPLRAIVTMPAAIEKISFGPKFALVRATSGERWAIDLRTGKRAAMAPVGLLDIASGSGGRAVALTDAGAALVSRDAGDHWTDVTTELRGRPLHVVTVDDELWIEGGGAWRVDADKLSLFDRMPVGKANELRKSDPRWREAEPPIRRAIAMGAPLDAETAVVVSDGDIVRINVLTGEIVGSTPGRFPPDVSCEAVRTPDDVLFVCAKSGSPMFVASHLTGEKAPLIEQTFAAPGILYAGDDGALAFGGPCSRPKASRLVACVRASTGGWQEYDLEAIAPDAGGAPFDVVRWIPRADGSAVGLTGGVAPRMIDARTGDVRALQLDGTTGAMRATLAGRGRPVAAGRLINRTWTASSAGELRGWSDTGMAIAVGPAGDVSTLPFTFERAASAGPFALARTRDARLWQTSDRGATWIEVAAPPSGASVHGADGAPKSCSLVGCDLGNWYRIGWPAIPPTLVAPPHVVSAPARIEPVSYPTIACTLAGDPRFVSIPRTDVSPDDLGLGATRIPVAVDRDATQYLRSTFGRDADSAPHKRGGSPSPYAASRAIVTGVGTVAMDDHFKLLGPGRPADLRRPIAFVAPFDPDGAIHHTSIGTTDALAAARVAGMLAADVLREDMTSLLVIADITPAAPAAPNGIFFEGPGGLVVTLGASAQAQQRVAIRVRPSDDVTPISGVALGPDEIAVLEVDAMGTGSVYKMIGTRFVDLFDVPAPNRPSNYPANPDALAVGPHGELGTVRTSSGAEPPSALDPAILSVPGARPVVLAPWSTIETADSAACKADPAGFRMTVQTAGPWFRFASPDLKADESSPMFARVRWSTTRVCLEALEIRVPDVSLRLIARTGTAGDPHNDESAKGITADGEAWIVARFAGTPSATRLTIVPGAELRQPMRCALGTPR